MKKVLAVLLVVVMVLSLTACGGGVSTGTYKLTGLTMKMGDQEIDYMELAKAMGMEDTDLGYLEIIDDKNAVMKSIDEDEQKLTYDDKYFYAANGSDEEKISYKASGSKITFTYEEDGTEMIMTFEK